MQRKSLTGKVAIVTGGAGGMGLAHARRLADRGAGIAIFDIDLNVASRYGEELTHGTVAEDLAARGVASLALEVDLSEASATKAAIDEVAARFGSIDIVVNNAGGAITPMENSFPSLATAADTSLLFNANFYTMVNVCQAAVPHLKAVKGTIVNIVTAGVDRDGRTGHSAMYRAAKAACLKYSNSLAVELGPYGVRVNCVAPGLIATARIKAMAAARGIGTDEQSKDIPLRRLGTPEDVTGAVEYLVTEELSGYVTGECIRVTGGQTLVAYAL